MRRLSGSRLVALAASAALVGAGCSADDQGPSEQPLVLAKTATKSGDNQSAPAGEALGNDLRVVITRDGAPVEQVSVSWSTGNGGSLSPSTSATNAEGIAVTRWTLGPGLGLQAATATVTGAEGSPLSFTATATEGGPPPPGPTVQVLGPDGGNRFDPAQITVDVGETVTWVWPEGSLAHNVTPDNGVAPRSGITLENGPHTFSYTFTEAGTYQYYCRNHGDLGGLGMAGTVTVTAGQL